MELLGRVYLEGGKGIRPDAENAEVWLARAADRGDVSSMTLLGSAHLDKIVPDSDPQQGIDYLHRPAAQGHDPARARHGTAYLFGPDGGPDRKSACRERVCQYVSIEMGADALNTK